MGEDCYWITLGKTRVYLKKDVEPRFTNTDLEEKFEDMLLRLGYRRDIDYLKQHPVGQYHIDFAFVSKKIAFEPGATYWHTPKEVYGEKLNPFGSFPEEVYFPVKREDRKKHEFLTRLGWKVHWLNEDFQKMEDRVLEWIKRILE